MAKFYGGEDIQRATLPQPFPREDLELTVEKKWKTVTVKSERKPVEEMREKR
jgi:hypothetical protein